MPGITLEDVLSDVHLLDSEHQILLSGSIAEGFGNPKSDVDILVIYGNADVAVRSLPDMLYLQDRRVEVRHYSEGGLIDLERRVRRYAIRGESVPITHHEIDVYYRVIIARALRVTPRWRRLQARFSRSVVNAAAMKWHSVRARACLEQAQLSLILMCPQSAIRWAREAAHSCLDARMVERGEAYMSSKWIFEKIRRLQHNRSEERTAATRLLSQGPPSSLANAESEARQYVADCLVLAEQLGVRSRSVGPGDLMVRARTGVRSSKVGGEWFLINEHNLAYLLDAPAFGIWRLIDGTSLTTVLERLNQSPNERMHKAANEAAGFIGLLRLHSLVDVTVTGCVP